MRENLIVIVPSSKKPSPPRFTKSKWTFIWLVVNRLLSPERAALGETGLATGGLAEDLRAAGADDDGLCVGEDGGDGEASGALDVHEERAGTGDKGLNGIVLDLLDSCGGDAHPDGCRKKRTLSLCLRASAAGVGLRRSTARTCHKNQCQSWMAYFEHDDGRLWMRWRLFMMAQVSVYSLCWSCASLPPPLLPHEFFSSASPSPCLCRLEDRTILAI